MLTEISWARNSTLRFWLFRAILIKEALELVCGVPIADGSQSVFEQKETKLRIRGISYSRPETRLIYRYLSNTPGGGGRGGGGALSLSSQCLLINARYQEIERYPVTF